MIANSGLFQYTVIDLLFHLSLTLLFAIAKHLYLAFEDGSPIFEADFLPPYLYFYLIISMSWDFYPLRLFFQTFHIIFIK